MFASFGGGRLGAARSGAGYPRSLRLDGRARHRPIAAKHATIPLFRLQPFVTTLADVEELTRFLGHDFKAPMAAMRAGYRRFKLHPDHPSPEFVFGAVGLFVCPIVDYPNNLAGAPAIPDKSRYAALIAKGTPMRKRVAFSVAAVVFAVGAAVAQTPYAGMQTRSIKALSDQQIADLRSGRGMGLALAAELNGYPGPSHLLELADKLHLSDAQRSGARSMFEAMKAETIPIGERLIAEEAALDKLFADHAITPEKLTAATAEIGKTQAQLRAAHLKYHLSTVTILQPSQIEQYSALRGYDDNSQEHHHHH